MFAEYQWIDDNTKWFETDKLKKSTSQKFNYKKIHQLLLSDHIVENIGDMSLVVSVYGKLSKDEIKRLVKEYGISYDPNPVVRE